jgi:hypothetical protein
LGRPTISPDDLILSLFLLARLGRAGRPTSLRQSGKGEGLFARTGRTGSFLYEREVYEGDGQCQAGLRWQWRPDFSGTLSHRLLLNRASNFSTKPCRPFSKSGSKAPFKPGAAAKWADRVALSDPLSGLSVLATEQEEDERGGN